MKTVSSLNVTNIYFIIFLFESSHERFNVAKEEIQKHLSKGFSFGIFEEEKIFWLPIFVQSKEWCKYWFVQFSR